jgi:hypothetical protein
MSCCIAGNCPPCETIKPVPSDVRTCFTKLPEHIKGSNKLKAAFLKGTQWDQGHAIKIGFYRDNNYTEHKATWCKECIEKNIVPLVNLKFIWDVDINQADVRITFDPALGAWSMIGKQALDQPTGPTMNLGWLDDETNYDFPEAKNTGAVIVHEFGHMIGMIHEHSRADAKLPWNCNAVYQSLGGPPNNWSKQMVNENVFEQIPVDQFNGSSYDPYSIMHYYFDPSYFCGAVKLPHNTKLSDLDKEWITKTYPTQATLAQKHKSYILIGLVIVVLIFAILFYLKFRS